MKSFLRIKFVFKMSIKYGIDIKLSKEWIYRKTPICKEFF
jgi:hypothetical protein